MTKRKRTNQKKTHPKLYQNKRSLAKLHCTNDTIVQCFLFEKATKMRGFFGIIKQKQPAVERFPSRLFAFLKQ